MSGPLEEILGKVVLTGQKTDVQVSSLGGSGKNVLGLYFSAHWCPPCRAFTPELAKFYKKMKDQLEIVFISSDEDEAQWAEYFASMPWLALPFADRERKEALSKKYNVEGIPTLVLIDASTGATLNAEADGMVEQHPDGKGFPWKS